MLLNRFTNLLKEVLDKKMEVCIREEDKRVITVDIIEDNYHIIGTIKTNYLPVYHKYDAYLQEVIRDGEIRSSIYFMGHIEDTEYCVCHVYIDEDDIINLEKKINSD